MLVGRGAPPGCSIVRRSSRTVPGGKQLPGSGQNGPVSEDGDTGRPVLRIAGPDDAIALMKLRQRLDEETSFMLLEPGERDTSIQALAEASGQGVGTGLLEEAKRWAAARGLRRIELNVMAHNHRAIALYERAGFVREGRRVDCLLIDGTFLDELSMAMILPGSLSPWRRPESNRVGNACKARPLPQLLIPVVPGRDGARPGLSVLHAVEMSSSVHVHPQVVHRRDARIRTRTLPLWRRTLSQLSYIPVPCSNCAW